MIQSKYNAAGSMCFEHIAVGELSKHGLSDEMIQMHPSLPWRQINGLRNHIVHGYEGIRLNIVWDTIVDDFPPLLKQLKTIAKEKN